MEQISGTDHVRNEEVLQTVKEERNVVHTIKRMKSDWVGHILHRNCLLKHVIEGKLEERTKATGRRRRRRKQILDYLKERTEHCKSKEEALDDSLCRNHCLRGYGPVSRQTTGRMNECIQYTRC